MQLKRNDFSKTFNHIWTNSGSFVNLSPTFEYSWRAYILHAITSYICCQESNVTENEIRVYDQKFPQK